MIVGCDKGFDIVLEYSGVGYRAELKGNDLLLNLGFSHPVNFPAPDGITFDVEPKARLIKIKGRDRQQWGRWLRISASCAHRNAITAPVSAIRARL